MVVPIPVSTSEVRAQRAEHGQPCAAQGYEVLSVALAGLAGGSVQVIFRGPCYGFAVIAGNFPNVLLSTGRIRQAGAIGTVPAFRANLGTCVYLAPTRDGLPPASMITIRVPTGETGTLELAVATEPTACLERFCATVLFDETGTIIGAGNALDVNVDEIGGTDQTGVNIGARQADITFVAPTTATVGAASASAVAARAGRRYLYLKNTSTAGQRISLAFDAAAAVLDSGITLEVGEWREFYSWSGPNHAVTVNAIASAASARLSIQEGT